MIGCHHVDQKPNYRLDDTEQLGKRKHDQQSLLLGCLNIPINTFISLLDA